MYNHYTLPVICLMCVFDLLFFSHNKLSSLPNSLGCLVSLSTLKLDHNNLTSLGTELGQMKQLEEMVNICFAYYTTIVMKNYESFTKVETDFFHKVETFCDSCTTVMFTCFLSLFCQISYCTTTLLLVWIICLIVKKSQHQRSFPFLSFIHHRIYLTILLAIYQLP